MATKKRSLVKAATYRTLDVVLLFLIGYFYFDSVDIATKIVLFDLVFKSVLYYTHERLWSKIKWGKE